MSKRGHILNSWRIFTTEAERAVLCYHFISLLKCKIYRSWAILYFVLGLVHIHIVDLIVYAVCNYLANSRGLIVDAQNIVITKGSQMGIYLTAQLLIEPGDLVAIGTSNYTIADETFRYSGAKLLRIPVNQNGMDIAQLEVILRRKRIKAVYIIPHHPCPTTVTMSMERRLKLLNLAKEYRFAVLKKR